ncbi:hypothetical protein FSST1_000267 [Fusarium sambucinum]
MDQLTKIWLEAQVLQRQHLTVKEQETVEQVDSYEHLCEKLGKIQAQYKLERWVRLLARMDPFVSRLRSFATVLSVFAQAKPEVLSFVWGSVALVLELAAGHSAVLESIVDTFEQMERVLPRFQCYVEEYMSPSPTITHLRDAIRRYYQELIDQCQDYIRFLKASPLKNFLLLGRTSRKLRTGSTRRLKRLRHLSLDVEQEARIEEHRITYRTLNSLRVEPTMATVLPYHGVTYRQNPAFYPRPQYLEQISAVLGPDTPRGLTSFALVGFGGCGKTQLAIDLQLSESFAMHARQLDLIKGDDVPQQDRIISLVKQRLLSLSVKGKPSRWLMIFDNMEPFDGLSSFWPSGLSGSILVTTRNKTLAKEFTESQVSIPPFEPLDARRFLLQYRTSGTEPTCQEDNAANIISQRLGNLPLALDLIRHHVSASGSSYKDFLKYYGEPSELFLYHRLSSTWKNEWYHQNLFATYTLGMQKLTNKAVDMIHVLAILDVSCIPLSIFGADKEDMLCNGPDVEDELPQLQDLLESPATNIYELDAVVSELMDGSLIDRNVGSGSLSLHRILQDSVAHSFDAATRSRSFNKVLFYLNGCFPAQHDGGLLFEQWYLCEQYIPHIFSVVQFYRKNMQSLDSPVMLAEIIRRYLLEKHQFTEAKILVRDALEICKRARISRTLLGFTQYRYIPRLLSDLYNVMGALEYESNTEGHGLRWAMKARSIRQELCLTLDLERDKCMLQVFQNNIALDMLANGQLLEALPLLEAVHEYDASTSGVNTDNFYRTLNLSTCYRLLGKYINAMDCSNIAMRVIQEHIGEDSVPMATARFCWGNLLLCMDDRVGAYNAFSMCFLTRQKLMPAHFDTAFAAHKLGAMAVQNGDLGASIQFLTQALQILGDTDPMSLAAIRTAYLLSIVLLQSNQSDAAKLMRSRVNQALEAKGKRVDAEKAGYSQSFFNSLVLFRHL